jgi:colicin import membrane protein
MNHAARDPLKPTPTDRLGPGAALALGAHALLVVGLTMGLQWRSHAPTPMSAELWAAVPQVAAPPAPAPAPAPEPAPAPPPPPAPAPAPAPAPPPPAPPPQAQRDADIAAERAKREREAREAREAELKRQQAEQERRERAERERAAREQAAREQAAREKAERERADRERRVAEEKRRAEDQRRREQAEARRAAEEQRRLEQQRQQNLARLMDQAREGGPVGTGSPTSTGTAARDAGPSAGYAGRIVARVKPNIIFTDEIAGNPAAEVELRMAPDGTIVVRRLVKASGVAAWDDAVLRAIDRTAVLPRDVDGRVPSPIVIVFRPRD